jgi:hypothetical protein
VTDPWGDLQSRFVDDPPSAVSAAADLVHDRLDRMRDHISRSVEARDTEELRRAFRSYRQLHRSLTGDSLMGDGAGPTV